VICRAALAGSAPTRLACYDAKAAYFILLMGCSYGFRGLREAGYGAPVLWAGEMV
jgi:hypothetical protein